MKPVLFLFLLMTSAVFAQDTVLSWHFFQPVTSQWMDAGTFGSVQEKLIARGDLPDPFYGKNEDKFGWIEQYDWEFISQFVVTDEMLQKDFIELNFPGIDTYASIYLNDSLLGFAENAFRPYRFQVKGNVHKGINYLKVVFVPPVKYHKEAYLKEAFHLPAPNDVDSIQVAPYTRKPQYQFGWDWALRMNTVGFLKPVSVSAYNHVKNYTKNITVEELSHEKAIIRLAILTEFPVKGNLIWKSKLFGETMILDGQTEVERHVILDDPKLWWPRGQGEQHLYSDVWTLLDEKGNEIDRQTVRFGVRKTELIMEPDQWGTSFYIKVNGRSVFCKGADYIPQDIFPARVTEDDLRKMVRNMAESNFNMVRVWGGGYYPDEAFLDACDQLGIMVWEDFMFACAMYPGDDAFLKNVQQEFDYQIPRLASHASLTIFNGNNEVDVAWKNWGFQRQYQLNDSAQRVIEKAYDTLFKQMLPERVSAFTNTPYVHTSPLSNWGKEEFYNHGTQHYWGVWHGKDPLEDFGRKIGRFNDEYGFQSFPEYSTLHSFSTKADWDLNSEVMKQHQKSYVGNGMILKHAQILYGKPATFEDFVYYSQLTQAEAVGMGITGHRLDAPRCMGTIYWQLNDCWPAPTWSSMDYYFRWKALQYRVREDMEDVAVLRKKQADNFYHYYLLSDMAVPFTSYVEYTVYDLEGKQLAHEKQELFFQGNETKELALKLKNPKQNFVVLFTWNNARGEELCRTFSEINQKYSIASGVDVTLQIEEIDSLNKTAVVIVDTKKFLRNFWLYTDQGNIRFSNNFIDILPGKQRIHIYYDDKLPSISDFGMKWM